MNILKVSFAANISYSGVTFNTPLIVEYRHTGTQYFKKPHHYTENPEIAQEWKRKGKKVTEKPGYYFMDRIAIPTTKTDGSKDIWYINNPGDTYKVNKVSKYGQKVHEQLSKHQTQIATN